MKRILIVDDSATVRSQLRSLLAGAGYDVTEASDGQAGVEVLRASASFDLVLCDVNMPRMNGIEMLEALSADEALEDLPVLMLTTECQPPLISRAKAAGARGWILKPFRDDALLAAAGRITGAT